MSQEPTVTVYKPIKECEFIFELLADPARFCTGVKARNAEGVEVDPCDPAAVQWCLAGAWERIYGVSGTETPLARLKRIGASCILDKLCESQEYRLLARGIARLGWDLSKLNDELGHQKVYELMCSLGI